MANTNYKIIFHDKIPSTQTACADLIARGRAADRTAVMAGEQTAGRGRGAHKWTSKPGNLYASFIFDASGERRPALSYNFAVAAASAIASFGVPVRVKWPNDIQADGGKKICGILLEYCRDFLIVGIGINIKSAPKIPGYPTAKIADWDAGATPNAVVAELMKSMDRWLRADWDAVRRRWLELAFDEGTEIIWRGRAATYCGLSDTGAMIARVGDRYQLIYGDEVFS
jgi:BirA family biotin operon repressor/biotin-[acetyl-CoA-carboxylase] ligase